MSDLRTGINELKSDFFKSSSTDLRYNRFSQQDNSLFDSNTTSSDHNKIILNNSIMRESSNRSNIFFSKIRESAGIIFGTLISSFSNSINLFVKFSSMMESFITSSRNSPSYSGWMPWSNTTNSPITSMSLLR
jgi:hypothetical protein